jgi:hypothetical protein
MKKYLICLMAVGLAIGASAFTSAKKSPVKAAKAGTYYWWDFNGGLLQQWNPDFYSIDDNQFPECYYMIGLIYCEIKALPMQDDPYHPDLTTVVAQRYRPLL